MTHKYLMKTALAVTLGFAVSETAFAQDTATAFTGATLYPISGAPIENGTLVVHEGKIIAIGANVSVPEGAVVIDATGMVIMPGLVDTHSHIALTGDGHASKKLNPEMRISDAIWPADPRIKVARTGGVTTANIMPGSGNIIGGQTAYVKLRGNTIEDMLVEGSIGGMKMANGTNPKGKNPSTRMGTAAKARQAYLKAQGFVKKRDEAAAKKDDDKKDSKDKKSSPPKRDLANEALAEILDGKRIIHHHTHRADDIMTVLRLQKEFGFRVVLQHGTEAFKVADEIAKRNIPVSAILVDSPGGKHETMAMTIKSVGILEKAGVKIAFHTDDGITESRFLLRQAALGVRGGMSREGALRAVTQNPADMLDLGARLGSLDVGKDADFIMLNGDPFSTYTHVTQTWIDGIKYFDRNNGRDRLYQTGGWRVADRYPGSGDE